MAALTFSYFAITIFIVISLYLTQNIVQCSKRYTLNIVNDLPNNDILTTHCVSGDGKDDRGVQNIAVGDSHAEHWTFGTNFGMSTQYYCDMHWVGGHCSHIQIFVDANNFLDHCGPGDTCSWHARADALYFYDNLSKSYMKTFRWQ